MDKSSYTKVIPEEFLWERYDEIFRSAKFTNDTTVMLMATDRQAALMGVSFDIDTEDDCDD